MAEHHHLIKRLHRVLDAFVFRRPLSPDETTRESSKNLSISCKNHTTASRSVLIYLAFHLASRFNIVLYFSLNLLLIEHDVVALDHVIVLGIRQCFCQNE